MLFSRITGINIRIIRCFFIITLGIWSTIINDLSNNYAIASSIWAAEAKDKFCQKAADEKSELCVIDIQRFQNGAEATVRLHLFEGKTGMPPHNEYFIWTNCKDEEYRVLPREPVHLPAQQRLQTIQAVNNSHLHKTLRTFGAYACEIKT